MSSQKSVSSTHLESWNPYLGTVATKHAVHTGREIETRLQEVQSGALTWAYVDEARRCQWLFGLASALATFREELATTITQEMGKPLRQSLAEVDKSISCLKYYGSMSHLDAALGPVLSAEVVLRPLGVVLAVMPWNFPLWQTVRVLAPQVRIGNVVALKPASNTVGTALVLERLSLEVSESMGLPSPLTVFKVPGSQVGSLIRDPRIRAVTLTGSEGAGAQVAAEAGRFLKKTVLELGGSDPYVLLPGADLSAAAEMCLKARLINTGQSCVAAKRFIVFDEIYDEFIERLRTGVQQRRMGDPRQAGTDLGPLARMEALTELERQLRGSLERGAREVSLNMSAPEQGWFWSPRLLVDVLPGQPAFDEETFGPLLAVTRYRKLEEAAILANQTKWGLGAAVFGPDATEARRWALRHLNTGMIGINTMVVSDPSLPFGGVGASGFGRELGWAGLLEFANLTTVLNP